MLTPLRSLRELRGVNLSSINFLGLRSPLAEVFFTKMEVVSVRSLSREAPQQRSVMGWNTIQSPHVARFGELCGVNSVKRCYMLEYPSMAHYLTNLIC